MRQIQIADRVISDSSPCYVIAEIGHNHGGSVQVAQQMIRVAAGCSADAVKLQKRSNETLYAQALLDQPYENENSFGKTYGEHRQALEFGREQYFACLQTARQSSITCFATAFDEPSADFLADLQVPAIKIASGGLTDHALLRHVAALRIPVILSTGGGTLREIAAAISTVWNVHPQVAVLHCTAAYPVRNFAELDLEVIHTLRELYPQIVIGWSGHDSGIAMALVAYTLGARIIEKHFTLNRANKGTDHAFSLEPSGLSKLCRDLGRAHVAIGDGTKKYYPSEIAPISKMRRRETPEGLRVTGERDNPSAA